MAVGVGPKRRIDDFDVIFGDKLGIILVLFIEVFFESIVHGIDGGLTSIVALHSVEVGFLNKK